MMEPKMMLSVRFDMDMYAYIKKIRYEGESDPSVVRRIIRERMKEVPKIEPDQLISNVEDKLDYVVRHIDIIRQIMSEMSGSEPMFEDSPAQKALTTRKDQKTNPFS